MFEMLTGVYEDLPHNTEFDGINFFAPFELWASANPWVKNGSWDNHFLNTYVQLKPGKNFQQISDLIKDAELNKIRNRDNSKEELARNRKVWLLPMKDWHLRSDLSSNASARLVNMIGMIGAFVLLLACINFMNLSTARSEKRAKEVGVRKAIGSKRGQLIRQFFSESFLVSLIAIITVYVMLVIFFYLVLSCCSLFIVPSRLRNSSTAVILLSHVPNVQVSDGACCATSSKRKPHKVLLLVSIFSLISTSANHHIITFILFCP